MENQPLLETSCCVIYCWKVCPPRYLRQESTAMAPVEGLHVEHETWNRMECRKEHGTDVS